MKNFYALIMAGGKGTRLWPFSQPDRPKALLALFGERSLFQETVARLNNFISPEHIFVVARPDLCMQLQHQEPCILAANFIREPGEKDSGPALALAALRIAQRDPSAVIAVLSVDQVIGDVARLLEALRTAYLIALDNWIVTLGVPPQVPATRFGYIQHGEVFRKIGDFTVRHVQSFVEKPDQQTAEILFCSGQYAWDSGMIVLSARRAIAEFEEQQPTMMNILKCSDLAKWESISPISLDYAIMQSAKNVLVIDVDLAWNDVGNWDTVFELSAKELCENTVIAPQHILIDTRRTLIRSDRRVVAIGMEDVIVVDTPEGLLICKRGCAEAIRRAIPTLEKESK